jgi:hypothetical protein
VDDIGGVEGVGDQGFAHHFARLGKQHRLGAGGADIDPNDVVLFNHGVPIAIEPTIERGGRGRFAVYGAGLDSQTVLLGKFLGKKIM